MRIRVTLSLDIDAEAWETTYGPSLHPGESVQEMLRRDVRDHVLNSVQNMSPFDGEVPATIELA